MAQNDGPPHTPNAKRGRLNSAEQLSMPPPNTAFTYRNSDNDWRKLIDNPNYVHFFIPKEIAEAFTEFLSKGAVALSKFDDKVIHIDSDEVELDTHHILDKAHECINSFKDLKRKFNTEIARFSDDKLTDKLNHDEFHEFKKIRSKLNKWFTASQHFTNKIEHSSDSNDYLKMSCNFSPAVKDNVVKDRCIKGLGKCKKDLENRLTESVIDNINKLQGEMDHLFDSTFNSGSDQDRLVVCKAMRTTLRNTFDLQHNRPKRFQRNGHSENYRRDHPRDYRHRRDDFENPRFDQNRRDGFENPRTYRNRREDNDNNYQSRPTHGRREYRVDDYDEDFPVMDRNVRQRKNRYVDNEEVFDEGRPVRRDRNYSTRSSTSHWTRI